VNILRLPNWNVTAVKENDHDIRVEATIPEETPGYCPKCMTIYAKVYRHGSRQQLIHDLPVHGKRVGILLNRTRYRCRNCEQTFLQQLSQVDDGKQMTSRLVQYVEAESLRRTFTSIAGDVGLDDKTVRNLFRAYAERLDASTVFETPTHMGVDEVHLLRKPRFVMTNLTERTIIAVLQERTKKVVAAHMLGMPDRERVEVVTMDMWRAYADAARAAFPNATVVVDKFHVVRMASQAMEVIRKAQREGLEPKFRRRLMHDRFILLRRPRDLDDDQRKVMAGWFEQFPKLAEAYRLKEAFYGLWDIPKKADAIAGYEAWERSITDRELLAAFKPLLTAMANWRTEIFAFWDHRHTNALTEALNGIAKAVERAGRGYSFEVIRAKLLYSKSVHKEARRPKYGTGFFRRGLPESEANYGTDVGRLLQLLEDEARRRT
jgi:transposase